MTRPPSGGYAVLATSLGCPFDCTFCAISAQFGSRTVRYLSIDQVMADIDLLVSKYNVKYIKILDECFVLNRDYVNQFCDQLIKRNYNLSIWGYARIDTVDYPLLMKLRRAGFTWLAYGVESGNLDSLNGVKKGQFGTQKVKEVAKMNRDAGIHFLANFMFGLPDDNLDTMHQSLELCRSINPEWINFYVTMPYPGSQIYRDNINMGKPMPDNWLAYAQYSYECIPQETKYLSPKEVLAYRDWAFGAFFENNDAYFDQLQNEFGTETVKSVRQLTKSKLKRKILGD